MRFTSWHLNAEVVTFAFEVFILRFAFVTSVFEVFIFSGMMNFPELTDLPIFSAEEVGERVFNANL